MKRSDFSLWETLKKRINDFLANRLASISIPSDRLRSAMEYAVLGQGKRLRPILVYLTGNVLGISLEKLDSMACAIECMHAYSLVHDDLPAMDNDDLRRGKLTCHRAFDEATAILAGDALQAFAFQQILLIEDTICSPAKKNETLLLLTSACGPQGMVSGQAMDLEYLNQPHVSEEVLKKIHLLKTGLLMTVCIHLPILLDDKISSEKKDHLLQFAFYFGLAFQIQDDYLDAYGKAEVLGKAKGADQKQNKITYVNYYTQTDLKQLIEETYQKAILHLNIFGGRAKGLVEFARYLSEREY